jgi:hypothetical protein
MYGAKWIIDRAATVVPPKQNSDRRRIDMSLQTTDQPREGTPIPMDTGYHRSTVCDGLLELIEQVRADRSHLPNGEESRKLAILVTQLELIEAYARRVGA